MDPSCTGLGAPAPRRSGHQPEGAGDQSMPPPPSTAATGKKWHRVFMATVIAACMMVIWNQIDDIYNQDLLPHTPQVRGRVRFWVRLRLRVRGDPVRFAMIGYSLHTAHCTLHTEHCTNTEHSFTIEHWFARESHWSSLTIRTLPHLITNTIPPPSRCRSGRRYHCCPPQVR